jgi:integrase
MGVPTKPIREYESMRRALTGLADSTVESYLTVMPVFCQFAGKDPDQIIAERKEQLRSDDEGVARTYERTVVRFYEHQKKRMSESAAYRYSSSTVRGFFSRNYVGLKFRRGDMRPPKTEKRDYIPTVGEVKEICDAADIRDKAIIILALQTGMAPIDLVGLKRADFERAIKSDEFPQPLGWLQRTKSREEFHPFMFRDSATALKRYLQNRKDDSPYLFVERTGEQMSERNVNDIFTKAAKRAGIAVPPGRRLRVYCLRSVFETQMGNAGMPQTWIDMMMGHTVGGARGKYVKPPEADWLEKARTAESFISISRVRNMDVLREKIDEARQGDMLELIMVLEKELGRGKMKRLAEGYLALKTRTMRMRKFDEEDLLPSERVVADALDEYLTLSKRPHKKIY